MATIQNDLVVKGLSGKVGKQLAVHRRRDGQYGICAAGLVNHQTTHFEPEEVQNSRLYEALFYTQPPTARESSSQADRSVTVADVIHPPEIHRIDISRYTGKSGELIDITAGDDVNVSSIGVLIVSDEGILVEKGSAVLCDRNPYSWKYVTKTNSGSRSVKIIVDVADVMPIGEE
jgi:hypothetical protein